MVKNPPAMQETGVLSLGGEDPLEEDMATPSSILAWRIPMDRGTWWATVYGFHKELDMTEQLSTAQAFKAKHNGGLSSGARPLGWGAWYGIQTSQSFLRSSAI